MYQIKIDNTIEQFVIDEQTQEEVARDAQLVAEEEQSLKDSKALEIQVEINAYLAAQQYQLQHGGPGPVGSFEVMKIVNEHNGQFEIIFN